MAEIKLKIDGREVKTAAGQSVLEAALEAGIYIPHLCRHPDLPPAGACRLCIVEIEGMPGIVTSCTTPAAEGMVVSTKTPRLEEVRRISLELMLVNHPADCTTCPKYLNCELQSLKQYLGITEGSRFRRSERVYVPDTGNPLFVHDFSRCVLCFRCIRACQELRGAGVLTLLDMGGDIHVGTEENRPLVEAGCRFCGACAEVCPTGALRDRDDALKISRGRRTGLVPCRYICPAGIDVPRYIRFIREKKYPQALAVIREKVPFPAVLGHICNHPCEEVCRRGEVNEAIAIRELKRFAAENGDRSWREKAGRLPDTGKRVTVVGSGPAGLTAAYYLARLGHAVTVLEALERPGGMLRYGVPDYRLPDEVLEGEIREIEETGVTIKTETRATSPEALLQEGADAVLLAIGAQEGVRLDIEGAGLEGVLVGIPFLREARRGRGVRVGKKVVVLGGGNVAFDCARTALRHGAEEVTIACLETREGMLATAEEIAEGCGEGITVHNSQSFVRIVGENGRAAGVACLDVACFEFDDEGNLNMECVEGSAHVLPADTVIFAVGQRVAVPEEFDLPTGRGNTLQVEYDNVSTEKEGVFAAGDAVTGTSSVIKAIAAGRRAADAIDQYLGGNGLAEEELAPAGAPESWLGPGEGFAKRPRQAAPGTAPGETGGYCESTTGYDEDAALLEAERCLQCDLRLKISRVKFWADYASG